MPRGGDVSCRACVQLCELETKVQIAIGNSSAEGKSKDADKAVTSSSNSKGVAEQAPADKSIKSSPRKATDVAKSQEKPKAADHRGREQEGSD